MPRAISTTLIISNPVCFNNPCENRGIRIDWGEGGIGAAYNTSREQAATKEEIQDVVGLIFIP